MSHGQHEGHGEVTEKPSKVKTDIRESKQSDGGQEVNLKDFHTNQVVVSRSVTIMMVVGTLRFRRNPANFHKINKKKYSTIIATLGIIYFYLQCQKC